MCRSQSPQGKCKQTGALWVQTFEVDLGGAEEELPLKELGMAL